jgi:GNAT superfamily N-acetyltransferase
MTLIIQEVKTKKDIHDFVNLPYRLYKNNNCWVPPIKKDEAKAIQADKNPMFRFADAKFWIVLKNGDCVGRIGALINHKYIEKTGKKYGRFTRMEFIDDAAVVDLLFETAENWLKEHGMIGVQGPLGFTNLDSQGLLVEGFDELQAVGSIYHLPYYKEHIERIGYEKDIDWLEFQLFIEEIPEKASKLADIIIKRSQLKVLHFDNNKELMPYVEKVFDVLNMAFDDLYSMVKFDEDMVEFYRNKYFKLLNPRFVKIIEDKDKEVVGFIIALPSLSRALQEINGKIHLLNVNKIFRALKKPDLVELLLTGVNPKYHGKGYSALLINELQKEMIENGVKAVETTGIFENNDKAISHWKNYKHKQHKRKRSYIKTF